MSQCRWLASQRVDAKRSIFDSSALKAAGLGAACSADLQSQGPEYISHLWGHVLENAEFYSRHQSSADFQLALDVGPGAPKFAAVRDGGFGILSRVVRIDGDGDGGKLVLELPDKRRVETAIIVARRQVGGAPSPTICVSSQAGCAMACQFCDTGFLTPMGGAAGMGTSLGIPAWAILEQVLHADAFLQREGLVLGTGHHGGRSANVVFMGMGEPLLNYRQVLEATRTLCAGMSQRRRVMLSTVGVSTHMHALAREAPAGLRLALSLHAPTQDLRAQLLPKAARAWPLQGLLQAVRAFEQATGTGVLLEYILLRGVNDEVTHAEQLAHLIQEEGLRCAGVNLIPYNPTAAGAMF